MSTKDYRTRDEIVVSIKNATAQVDAKKKKNKAPLPTPKPPGRFLHRRTQGGKTTFYDLGQTAEGVTLPLFFRPSVGINGAYSEYPYWVEADPLLIADYKTRFSDPIIAAAGGSDFSSYFRKIPKSAGRAFGIVISGLDNNGDPFEYDSLNEYSNWNADGLALTPGQIAGSSIQIADRFYYPVDDYRYAGLFFAFDLKDTLTYKFTTSYNFDAADAVYSYANGDKICLHPAACLNYGTSGTDGTFPINFRSWWLNMLYRIRPRNFNSPNLVYSTRRSSYSVPEFNEALSLSLASPPTPTRSFRNTVYSDGTTQQLVEFVGVGSFPASPENFIKRSVGFTPVFVPTGALLAIIEKGSSKYYVWQRVGV